MSPCCNSAGAILPARVWSHWCPSRFLKMPSSFLPQDLCTCSPCPGPTEMQFELLVASHFLSLLRKTIPHDSKQVAFYLLPSSPTKLLSAVLPTCFSWYLSPSLMTHLFMRPFLCSVSLTSRFPLVVLEAHVLYPPAMCLAR